MEVALSAQLRELLASFFLGVLLGAVWDVVRLSRLAVGIPNERADRLFAGVSLPLIGDAAARRRKPGRLASVFVFFGDVFFFLVAAVAFRLFLYVYADGAFRFFAVLGAAAGFGAYLATVGRLVLAASGVLLFCVRVAVLYAICPFRALFRLVRRAAAAVLRRVSSFVRRRRDRRRTRAYIAGMLREAETGFARCAPPLF